MTTKHLYLNERKRNIKSLWKCVEISVTKINFIIRKIVCNSEGIVTRENLREYVEQFLTAQTFCRFEDSSSDTSLLND
jgi:hypothetical protein